jgi:hypothetical protein
MKEHKMSNQWAQRKAAQKRDRRETARSLQNLVNDQFAAPRLVTKKERRERPATAAKRERKAIYGKYDPTNEISECCYMILANNGSCTGCGETPWHIEALRDEPGCVMA